MHTQFAIWKNTTSGAKNLEVVKEAMAASSVVVGINLSVPRAGGEYISLNMNVRVNA